MVRKATLAAWQSASLVELSRIEVRAGEEGEESDSCRKGRVGERRDLYFSIPSSSQQTLTLVLGTLGATTALGWCDVGLKEAGEAGESEVVVGGH